MLVPRKVKFRSQHHPNRRGAAKGGTKLAFGDYGIQALEGVVPDQPTDRVPPDRDDPAHQAWRQGVDQRLPGPSADQEAGRSRMGSGKGSPEWWIANVKPGLVLFELSGVHEDVAREAVRWRFTSCR